MYIVTKTLKKSFNYRNMGGKKITLERELTKSDIKKQSDEGNWSCYNFIERRKDFNDLFVNTKFYYGHGEDGLGYVICEDELEA